MFIINDRYWRKKSILLLCSFPLSLTTAVNIYEQKIGRDKQRWAKIYASYQAAQRQTPSGSISTAFCSELLKTQPMVRKYFSLVLIE